MSRQGPLARRSRSAAPALALALALSDVGCAGRPGGVVEALPYGAAVRAMLAPPRDVIVWTGADTLVLREARELLGRVTSVQGDTLRIALSAAGSAARPLQQTHGNVTVVRGVEAEVVVLSRNPEVMNLIALALPTLALAFLVSMAVLLGGAGT